MAYSTERWASSAWAPYFPHHNMVANAGAPDASQQPQSVVQQLWQQQYAQYSLQPAPGQYLQQSTAGTFYPGQTTHYGGFGARYDPNLGYSNSMRYGNDTGYGYAAQGQSVEVAAHCGLDSRFYYTPPTYAYSYGAQPYTPPQNAWYQASAAHQTWASQQPDHQTGWGVHQYSSYNQPQYAANWANSRPVSAQSGYIGNPQQTSEPCYQPSYRRDNYRPTYAKNLTTAQRNESLSAPAHSFLRRPLVAGRAGPPGRGIRAGPGGGMSPLSSYVSHRSEYDEQYPKPPACFDPFALPPDSVPFTPRRVAGIQLANTTDFITGYRQPSLIDGVGSNTEINPITHDGRQAVEQHRMTRAEDVTADTQQGVTSPLTPTLATGDDSTSPPEQQIMPCIQISEDLARQLSEPDMQIVCQPEAATCDIATEPTLTGIVQPAELDERVKLRFSAYDDVPSTVSEQTTSLAETPQRKSRKRDKISDAPQHSRSTTASSVSLPPPKRIKDEPTSSPALPAANAWSNFFAHIKQDDQNMVLKARDEVKRMGGDKFRPEIKEIYKDQRGKKEIKVHEKVAGTLTVKRNELEDASDDGGVKIEAGLLEKVAVKTECL